MLHIRASIALRYSAAQRPARASTPVGWWKAFQQNAQRHYTHTHGKRGAWKARNVLFGALGVSAVSSSGVAVVAALDREKMATTAATDLRAPQLPLHYDPAAFADHWDKHVCVQLARIAAIGAHVLPFLVRSAWLYYGPHADLRDAAESELLSASWGAELREMLVELGPTFIKFGQMLSIRPDLLPAAVLLELQKLCDAVPAFPTTLAIDLIEKELGSGAVERLYEGLDRNTEPVAAASLGQVYCVRLREHGKKEGTGALVALKVQRPDMVAAVSLDLHLLRRYMHTVEFVKSSLMWCGALAARKQFDIELLDTFASASFLELDYQHEAANQQRFIRELQQRGMSSTIRVPLVHNKLTTRRVLTTEWIHGKQLAQSSPATIRRLVPSGVKVFLVQLLDMGFFHSDPHPGNLLVDQVCWRRSISRSLLTDTRCLF